MYMIAFLVLFIQIVEVTKGLCDIRRLCDFNFNRPNYNFSLKPGNFEYPYQLKAFKDNLLLSDVGNKRLVIFKADGSTKIVGDGEFGYPGQITVYKDKIYVVDVAFYHHGSGIKVFGLDGTLLPDYSNVKSGLWLPWSIDIHNDKIYVVNQLKMGTIMVFSDNDTKIMPLSWHIYNFRSLMWNSRNQAIIGNKKDTLFGGGLELMDASGSVLNETEKYFYREIYQINVDPFDNILFTALVNEISKVQILGPDLKPICSKTLPYTSGGCTILSNCSVALTDVTNWQIHTYNLT